jgi:hypothetical protein
MVDAAGGGAAPPDPSGDATDVAAPPPTSGGGSSRRWLWVGGLALLVVVVVVIGVVLARPKPGYSDEDARKFREACTAEGGDAVRSACQCLYERIVVSVPYERYQEVDRDLAAQRAASPGATVTLPPDLDLLRVACVAQVSGTSTDTAPSAPVRGAEGPPASTPSS